MEKTTSPASASTTSRTVRVYLRPWRVAWKRPELPTIFPSTIHVAVSLVSSWDRTHSKLQPSPSSTSTGFSLLVMPTCRSVDHRRQLLHWLGPRHLSLEAGAT